MTSPPLLYRWINRWRRWREDRHVPEATYLQQIRALYRQKVSTSAMAQIAQERIG